ncbi:hypothetical protein L6452_25498 [Arctium lappa]|uniref:Uncharacterized protein n=1 Tax=Arctium lappa TaxID=4217 RepID=A0ACB9ABT0_ARCLA|nr:hypothetical protein L6452_25498 [Arctium lappa]
MVKGVGFRGAGVWRKKSINEQNQINSNLVSNSNGPSSGLLGNPNRGPHLNVQGNLMDQGRSYGLLVPNLGEKSDMDLKSKNTSFVNSGGVARWVNGKKELQNQRLKKRTVEGEKEGGGDKTRHLLLPFMLGVQVTKSLQLIGLITAGSVLIGRCVSGQRVQHSFDTDLVLKVDPQDQEDPQSGKEIHLIWVHRDARGNVEVKKLDHVE